MESQGKCELSEGEGGGLAQLAIEAATSEGEAAGLLRQALQVLPKYVENLVKARVRLAKANESNSEKAQRQVSVAQISLEEALMDAEDQAAVVSRGWEESVGHVREQASAEVKSKQQFVAFTWVVKQHEKALLKMELDMQAQVDSLRSQQLADRKARTESDEVLGAIYESALRQTR